VLTSTISQFALLLGTLLVLLVTGMPVFFAMGLACVVLVVLAPMNAPLSVIGASLVQGIDSYSLIAILLFMLAADIASAGGVLRHLIGMAEALVAKAGGNLAHVAVVASMVFSGASGSAIADAAAIGPALIPPMKRAGFSGAYAAAVVSAASSMGPVIPPSIAFVIYGWIANVSIGRLFMAGVVPGLLMGMALLGAVSWSTRQRRRFAHSIVVSPAGRHGLRSAVPALAFPAIIAAGMISGLTTATESSMTAAITAILLGVFVFRQLTLRDVWRIAQETTVRAGYALLIVAAAGTFSWLVASMDFGAQLVAQLSAVTSDRGWMLAILNVFFLVWGLAFEPPVAILTLVPVLLPVLDAYQIDRAHFGVMLVINLMVGQLTPPSGIVPLMTASIAEVPIWDVFKAGAPFVVALLLVLLLVTCVPSVCLWLPNAFGKF
jgi:tripartite ATP-independent transporter DctM subunit